MVIVVHNAMPTTILCEHFWMARHPPYMIISANDILCERNDPANYYITCIPLIFLVSSISWHVFSAQYLQPRPSKPNFSCHMFPSHWPRPIPVMCFLPQYLPPLVFSSLLLPQHLPPWISKARYRKCAHLIFHVGQKWVSKSGEVFICYFMDL